MCTHILWHTLVFAQREPRDSLTELYSSIYLAPWAETLHPSLSTWLYYLWALSTFGLITFRLHNLALLTFGLMNWALCNVASVNLASFTKVEPKVDRAKFVALLIFWPYELGSMQCRLCQLGFIHSIPSTLVAWVVRGCIRFQMPCLLCLKEKSFPPTIGYTGRSNAPYNIKIGTNFLDFIIIQIHICRNSRTFV